MNYLFPRTAAEALALLLACQGHGRVIAGGTDLLPDMEKGKLTPDCLVDITRIPELARITVADGWATVGAAVPLAALRRQPYFVSRVHALVDAAGSVGALPIQTAATWVGNLVQAMPAADGALVAMALDAEVRLLAETGERYVRVADLYAGPGRSVIDSTKQLVTEMRFPLPAGKWGTGWRRLGRRPALVLPTLSCAAKIVLEGDKVAYAAIAVGPAGPCPIRAHEAETCLVGRVPDAEAIREAAQLALCAADPRSNALRASRAYRLAVLPALVEEALTAAARHAEEHHADPA